MFVLFGLVYSNDYSICPYNSNSFILQKNRYYELKANCLTSVFNLTFTAVNAAGLPPGMQIEENNDIIGEPIVSDTFNVTISSGSYVRTLQILVMDSIPYVSGSLFYRIGKQNDRINKYQGTKYYDSIQTGYYPYDRASNLPSSWYFRDNGPMNYSYHGIKPFTRSTRYVMKASGYMYLPFSGEYEFSVNGDDMVFLFIDDISSTASMCDHTVGNTWPIVVYNAIKKGFFRISFYLIQETSQASLMHFYRSPANKIYGTNETNEDLGKNIPGSYFPTTDYSEYGLPEVKYLKRHYSFRLNQPFSILPSSYNDHGGDDINFTASCTNDEISISNRGVIMGSISTEEIIPCRISMTTPHGVGLFDMTIEANNSFGVAGLNVDVYKPNGLRCNYHQKENLKQSYIKTGSILYEQSALPFDGLSTEYLENFVLSYNGYVFLPSKERYTFRITAYGSYQLSIGGINIYDFQCSHSVNEIVKTESGYIPIEIIYWTLSSPLKSLKLEWSSESNPMFEVIPATQFASLNKITYQSPKAVYIKGNQIQNKLLNIFKNINLSTIKSIPGLPSGLSFNAGGDIIGTAMQAQALKRYYILYELNNFQNNIEISIEILESNQNLPTLSYNNITKSSIEQISELPIGTEGFTGYYEVRKPLQKGLKLDSRTGEISGNGVGAGKKEVEILFVSNRGIRSHNMMIEITPCQRGNPMTLTYLVCNGSVSIIKEKEKIYNNADMNNCIENKFAFCFEGGEILEIESIGYGSYSLISTDLAYIYEEFGNGSFSKKLEILQFREEIPTVDYGSDELKLATEGVSFSPLITNGGKDCMISPALPEDLKIESSTGRIYGKTAESFDSFFSVICSNSFGTSLKRTIRLLANYCEDIWTICAVSFDLSRGKIVYNFKQVNSNTSLVAFEKTAPANFIEKFGFCLEKGMYILNYDFEGSSIYFSTSIRFSGSSGGSKGQEFLLTYIAPIRDIFSSSIYYEFWNEAVTVPWPNYRGNFKERNTITTYYRIEFPFVHHFDRFSYIEMKFKSDGAVIIYLNNHLVYRRGLGQKYSQNDYSKILYSVDEIKEVRLNVNALKQGNNIMGIEIHKHAQSLPKDPFILINLEVFSDPNKCTIINTYDPPMLIKNTRGYEYSRELANNNSLSTNHVVNNLNKQTPINLSDPDSWMDEYLMWTETPEEYGRINGLKNDYFNATGVLGSQNPLDITMGFPSNIAETFTQYSIQTGVDRDDRDPWSWTLYGSYDNTTGDWDLLHEVTNSEITSERGAIQTFQMFNQYQSYEYYRFIFTKTRNSTEALHFARIHLQHCKPRYCGSAEDFPESKAGFTASTPRECDHGYFALQHRDCKLTSNEVPTWSSSIIKDDCKKIPTKLIFDELIFYNKYESTCLFKNDGEISPVVFITNFRFEYSIILDPVTGIFSGIYDSMDGYREEISDQFEVKIAHEHFVISSMVDLKYKSISFS